MSVFGIALFSTKTYFLLNYWDCLDSKRSLIIRSLYFTMEHHFTQLDDGASADVKPVSNFGAAVATVLLALLLQIFCRSCRSIYRNHVKKYKFSSSSAAAANMDRSIIAAVEKILKYKFKDKRLVKEALTHSSCREDMSYERLEFIGDAALGLAVATHFFCLEPRLNSDKLTRLREKSVSNERLALVAARHELDRFFRSKDTAPLNRNVRKYVAAVKQGDDHKNLAAPAILADIVEALAGAVYLDLNFDLTKLWTIFKDVLMIDEIEVPKDFDSSEIIGAQAELYGLCGKRNWGKPVYSLVKAERCQYEMKYVYSVEVETDDGVCRHEGDEKSTPKDARNSAAYLLLRSLQQFSII
ncbi:ribonuclease 3-like protein 2 [Gossypium australe]|uniref:Ribonuclease 3-like protein 2 n=1 Tax=Gossypium australe TaxID=47621 RepID=A0A5B6VR47_9ROSI|nr:ribonuclease 3-like protein 2 [Gossypium australe]